MRRRQRPRLLLVVGAAAVGLGVVVTFVPGAARLFGGSGFLVSAIGLLALVQTARVASDFWNRPRRDADLPDAYERDPPALPGEDVDREVESSGHRGTAGRRSQQRLTRYLRETAVEVLVAETGTSREAVEASLDAGTWTDDSVAAALFADDYEADWRDRVRSVLGGETRFERRLNRAKRSRSD